MPKSCSVCEGSTGPNTSNAFHWALSVFGEGEFLTLADNLKAYWSQPENVRLLALYLLRERVAPGYVKRAEKEVTYTGAEREQAEVLSRLFEEALPPPLPQEWQGCPFMNPWKPPKPTATA